MARNLYRIDDVLLRAAALGALALLLAAASVVVFGLASGPDGDAAVRTALARHAPWLALGALGPALLLAAGLSMRRRERRIGAIWSLLRQNAEIPVEGLLANSDFERRDLERAVHFLNNRGLGHYLWDRESDAIQDARLRSSRLHVDKCEGCGASILLDVPVGFREVPRGPHCQMPASVDALQDQRDQLLEALRAESRDAAGAGRPGVDACASFSPLVFLLLLVGFWPAALGYAWLKWQGRL